MTGLPLPESFSGIARLFPLPDLVLFPHVVQPLRLFEPRYVRMLKDALDDDQLITMALLRPGWELDYLDQPPIHPTVCVSRVMTHSQQPDGAYHVLLAGLARAQVTDEPETDLPYRTAHVELLRDPVQSTDLQVGSEIRERLLASLKQISDPGIAHEPSFQRLINEDVPLGMLTDVIAFSLELSTSAKQDLLSIPVVNRRAQKLLELVHQLERSSIATPGYPPRFSDN